MKKSLKKKAVKVHKPVRSADVPVTEAMLEEMEQKLTHEMVSVKLDVKAVKSELHSFRHEVNARFESNDAKIETVLAAVHRVALLVEEQNARNKFVLDGYTNLYDRVEKLERKAEESL